MKIKRWRIKDNTSNKNKISCYNDNNNDNNNNFQTMLQSVSEKEKSSR